MPGYVIHLAIAKEYIRNFRVKDEKEFLKGSLAPDLLSTDDKKETHYTQTGSSDVNLKKIYKRKQNKYLLYGRIFFTSNCRLFIL